VGGGPSWDRGYAFGVLTMIWPGITVETLVLFFGAYALIDGVVSLAGAIRASTHHERWGALLFEGVTGILAGIVAFAWPGITVIMLALLIGTWAVITGIFEIAAAWRLRRHIQGEWILALTGVASVVFGVLVWIAPLAGALVLALWIGAYALIFGAMMVALGFRLRAHGGHIEGSPAPARG
jgi:uncharacterized membrane protein HdeD (DUF308 family)